MRKKGLLRRFLVNLILFGASLSFLLASLFFIWIATIQLPDLANFNDRRVSNSTKIYDRTGKVVLYNFHENVRRTEIPFSEMGDYIKKATVAVEDSSFYSHYGIRPQSILRATITNVVRGGFYQGGSTITQQVVKNAVLTNDKTPTRKIKEWILAVKLDRSLPKEKILEIYLNEIPYGGNLYGIEEASLAYFNKHAKDLELVEAAYLAAMPQAPTYYSPFGKNRVALEERKNFVLERVLKLGFVSVDEYRKAITTQVAFSRGGGEGGKALHFVFFVREYLEEKYGRDVVENGGLRVTTTLDYELQKNAEEIVKKHALENKKKYNAENAGLVAINPKTGELLVMVGSRDYFDKEINGNFNITTAHRQPGSSFKPIVYAEAFIKGYTPETVLFDVPTQFNAACTPDGRPKPGSGQEEKDCYQPVSYDGKYRGPVTMKEALAQSLNVPAVKTLYLAGVKDSLGLARKLGVKSLVGDENHYGLSLALGGGEVSLLELTEAFGVFANKGIRNPTQFILSIEDNAGVVLERYSEVGEEVVDSEIALKISDILSDNGARAPVFGARSVLGFEDRHVAVKTGTTNDFRDVWTIGYTPSIVVGVWGGNNDNSQMVAKAAAIVVAPLWREFVNEALKNTQPEFFDKPYPTNLNLKPVLRGVVCGGVSLLIDTKTGLPIDGEVNEKDIRESYVGGVHDILYWVDKNDPLGLAPTNKENDPQFNSWEIAVSDWVGKNTYRCLLIKK